MLKGKLLIVALSLSIIILVLGFSIEEDRPSHQVYSDPIEMPIVQDDPYVHLAAGAIPNEERGFEHRRWLAATLKIQVSNSSGSGTIVYFDEEDGWAYVQSCGHLWNGNMTAEEGLRKNIKCKVVTWYHNQNKLEIPAEYPAEVLYYSNVQGKDISLIRFKPDWAPNYFPIAFEDFKFTSGMDLHSVGCDGGREVAHYSVKFVDFNNVKNTDWPDVVTTQNSPRPGRSGGGLLTEDYYVGICWGTTDKTGNGNGYFTPLSTVRKCNEANGYGWLNEKGYTWARQIPIIDRNGPQRQYSQDYIPLPR